MPNDLSDELIVLRCQEGHQPSFARLVERWQPRLLRHARGLVWREDAALDVVQDTWLVVAKNVRSALERLPLEKRALLSMRYADDLDLPEIAET